MLRADAVQGYMMSVMGLERESKYVMEEFSVCAVCNISTEGTCLEVSFLVTVSTTFESESCSTVVAVVAEVFVGGVRVAIIVHRSLVGTSTYVPSPFFFCQRLL